MPSSEFVEGEARPAVALLLGRILNRSFVDADSLGFRAAVRAISNKYDERLALCERCCSSSLLADEPERH